MGEKGVLKEEEMRELLKGVTGSEKLEKDSAISWDGRNLIIRIPREIADYLKLNEENRFENNFRFTINDKDGNKIQTFEIVKRTKLMKEKKQNDVSDKKSKKNNRN